MAVAWLGRAACAAACLVVVGPTLDEASRGAPMADFAVYWTAARLWLDGGDPTVFSALHAVAPEPVGGPFAYPVWTLLPFAPWAALPFPLAKALWAALTGLALASGAAAWAALADAPRPRRRVEAPAASGLGLDSGAAAHAPAPTAAYAPATDARSAPVARATRAAVVTLVCWWALRSTVSMGLLPGNLAALQAAALPWAALWAVRSPSGLGALALMTPFAMSRWAPLVWLPAWWPRGRSGAALRWLGGCVVAALLVQLALGLSDPWGGVLTKLADPLPLAVDHSVASALQQAGLSRAGALALSLGLAIVFAASAGRALLAERDADAIVAWIAATLLFVPRLPDYEWLLLPGLVTFTLLRARTLHALPLVVALLLPDHGARLALISTTALWALRKGRAAG